MHIQRFPKSRTGGILPMVVVSLVALIAFVAMAIDVGMIALARTQVQHVADTAAMTAARSLNGGASPDLTLPDTNAKIVAASNTILSDAVQTTNVTTNIGTFHYDDVRQTFVPLYTVVPPDNHNLAEVTVTHSHPSAFGNVLGVPNLNVTATAVAAHRPRDVAMVLDFSGSMNNESDVWNVENYLGTYKDTPNNADPVFPQFGPYDTTFSPLAKLQQTDSDPRVGRCNVTQEVMGVHAMVNDFYQHERGSSPIAAFNPAPSAVTNTSPGGDLYLLKQGTSTTARTWSEISHGSITSSPSAKFEGYLAGKHGCTTSLVGWTQGPGYWGKTFFVWPPDPDKNKDWRKKFFLNGGGSHPTYNGPCNDNRRLYTSGTGSSAGSWQDPGTAAYVINYKNILKWIKDECVQSSSTDPKPFPAKLRAGRILFYDAIPDDVPAAAYDHATNNANIAWANQNQRFWKEYIDYTLGVWRDPYGSIRKPNSPSCSLGGDYTSGSATSGTDLYIYGTSGDANYFTWYPDGYIHPRDNPKRPRHRFWFGPMTMIQFMSDTGLLPGTARDISLSVAKLGINGALKDIENNHPNDLVTMLLYNRPQFNNDPPATGSFNSAQFALSRDYAGMISALWYPPNSETSDVLPWDANGLETPRGHGDYNANTATMHGFLLAYNQMSSNATLKTTMSGGQSVGGLGRKGAQRIIVLETDGMANINTNVVNGFANYGPNNSYYHILPGDTVNSTGYSASNLYPVVQAICNLPDGMPGTSPGYSPNPGYPGYATASKPVLIHTLAFGAVFEPTASGTEASNAVAFLQQISTIGGTVFPSSSSDPDNGYKWIIGTLDERKAKLQQAFRNIMDTGNSVSLVR